MPLTEADRRWLAATAALAARARPLCRPNPGVGALVVKDGRVVGLGRDRLEAGLLGLQGLHVLELRIQAGMAGRGGRGMAAECRGRPGPAAARGLR